MCLPFFERIKISINLRYLFLNLFELFLENFFFLRNGHSQLAKCSFRIRINEFESTTFLESRCKSGSPNYIYIYNQTVRHYTNSFEQNIIRIRLRLRIGHSDSTEFRLEDIPNWTQLGIIETHLDCVEDNPEVGFLKQTKN